jgi:hypothetical protein
MTTMRAHWLFVALACAPFAAVAQACSNDTPATGSSSHGNPGSTTLVGDAGLSTSDAGKTSSDAGKDSGTVIVDAGPAMCDPTFVFTSDGALPGLDNATLSQFGAVSGTELSLAWTASTGDVYVADRVSTSANFSTAAKANGSTALAVDRVALSPTGTQIIAVSADRKSFIEIDRSTIGGTWTVGSSAAFANIVALLDEQPPGSGFAEPVIAADNQTFFFVATIGNAVPFIYESRFNTTIEGWAGPNALSETELRASDAAHRRRPTGASADRRTLFFYDEVNGVERAAWRDNPDAMFTLFVDETGFNEGAPNATCQTLYYQGAGPAVFTAD